ncbi:MAG: hypothetical protein AAFQ18_01630, partial [Pseudomonadota bacterium]
MKGFANDGQVEQVLDGEQAGSNAIINIMIVVGNIVGQGGNLRFGAGKGGEFQVFDLAEIPKGGWSSTMVPFSALTSPSRTCQPPFG